MNPVRLEFSRELNKKMIAELCGYINVKKSHTFLSVVPLDLSFVFTIQNYMKNRGDDDLFY